MGRLTVTELKVLAKEASNRVLLHVNEQRRIIKASDKYANFEQHFLETSFGKAVKDAYNSGQRAEAFYIKEIQEEKRRYAGVCFTSRNTYDEVIKRVRTAAFPELNPEIIPHFNTGYNANDFVDYFMHQFTLNQLTTNSDFGEVLDKLVQNLIDIVDGKG